MITNRSTYETVVREIERAVLDVALDQALEPDEVYADVAESMLYDASESVAREVCRVQIGAVPPALSAHWRERQRASDAARRDAARLRTAARAAERETARQTALDRAAERRRLLTCGDCFTVRAPSGACNC